MSSPVPALYYRQHNKRLLSVLIALLSLLCGVVVKIAADRLMIERSSTTSLIEIVALKGQVAEVKGEAHELRATTVTRAEFGAVVTRLDRIEDKLDRLLERVGRRQ